MKNTRKSKRWILGCALILGIALAAVWLIWFAQDDADSIHQPKQDETALIPLCVTQVETVRLSSREIEIKWPDSLDAEVECYVVKKRPTNLATEKWDTVGILASDCEVNGDWLQMVDTLADSSIQQYEYTVDIEVQDPKTYLPQAGTTVLASNLLICIDPGHYSGANQVDGYSEGDAMLQLGQILKTCLKNEYGIDACMTRNSESITIGGYSDEVLDKMHIGLRGNYAGEMGSDLLISLHTNANEDNANGYPTCWQPISINKPVLIANIEACASQWVLDIANEVGCHLSKVNFETGLATVETFRTVSGEEIMPWTKDYNDKLDTPGTVFKRLKQDQSDYYGVLRGAASENIPGLIIEHGMHTVEEVRRAAMEGELIEQWAKADAAGIAQGLGFRGNYDVVYI